MNNQQKIDVLVKMHQKLLALNLSTAAIDIAFSDAVEELAPKGDSK